MPNFSSLAGVEVTEKFVGGWVGGGGGFQVATVFSLNPSYFELL